MPQETRRSPYEAPYESNYPSYEDRYAEPVDVFRGMIFVFLDLPVFEINGAGRFLVDSVEFGEGNDPKATLRHQQLIRRDFARDVANRTLPALEVIYLPEEALEDVRRFLTIMQRLDRGRMVCQIHGVKPGDDGGQAVVGGAEGADPGLCIGNGCHGQRS